MTVVKSIILEDQPQKDNRRRITEQHTFDNGGTELVSYLGAVGDDAAAMLPIRAALIETRIAEEQQAAINLAVAQKARATELLKLTNPSMAAILMVPAGRIAEIKAELESIKAKP